MSATPAPLRIAPPPSRVRQNPRSGVRRDPEGQAINPPHAFRTLGRARLWKAGVAGPWIQIPSEDPRPDGGLR